MRGKGGGRGDCKGGLRGWGVGAVVSPSLWHCIAVIGAAICAAWRRSFCCLRWTRLSRLDESPSRVLLTLILSPSSSGHLRSQLDSHSLSTTHLDALNEPRPLVFPPSCRVLSISPSTSRVSLLANHRTVSPALAASQHTRSDGRRTPHHQPRARLVRPVLPLPLDSKLTITSPRPPVRKTSTRSRTS